ncbi:MAG TPA: FkbM family methyltransferase, partial [Nitrososphaerales archaeon]|nr:FkbM family methyltransferase [Nitrososphaerales archaeon]
YRGYMVTKMVSLDHVKFPITPSVLVVDCEGYEGEVLLGARKTMEEVRLVFIETHVVGRGQSTLSGVLSQVEAVPMTTSVFQSEDQLSWVSGVRRAESAPGNHPFGA